MIWEQQIKLKLADFFLTNEEIWLFSAGLAWKYWCWDLPVVNTGISHPRNFNFKLRQSRSTSRQLETLICLVLMYCILTFLSISLMASSASYGFSNVINAYPLVCCVFLSRFTITVKNMKHDLTYDLFKYTYLARDLTCLEILPELLYLSVFFIFEEWLSCSMWDMRTLWFKLCWAKLRQNFKI